MEEALACSSGLNTNAERSTAVTTTDSRPTTSHSRMLVIAARNFKMRAGVELISPQRQRKPLQPVNAVHPRKSAEAARFR